jgi:large subunit ribosomal protein L13
MQLILQEDCSINLTNFFFSFSLKEKLHAISTKGFTIMTMNRAFYLRKEDRNPAWKIIDAEGKVLGRLATEVAEILRGKDKAHYTPHTDCGDYVVIINAEKVKLTGDKWRDKLYISYSGWMSGKKTATAEQVVVKHPTRIVELAIRRMLPKNTLNNDVFRKLKVYAGAEHPHIAQAPKAL